MIDILCFVCSLSVCFSVKVKFCVLLCVYVCIVSGKVTPKMTYAVLGGH